MNILGTAQLLLPGIFLPVASIPATLCTGRANEHLPNESSDKENIHLRSTPQLSYSTIRWGSILGNGQSIEKYSVLMQVGNESADFSQREETSSSKGSGRAIRGPRTTFIESGIQLQNHEPEGLGATRFNRIGSPFFPFGYGFWSAMQLLVSHI